MTLSASSSHAPFGDDVPFGDDALIERLAQRIIRLGLETPALLLLESHRPVIFLAGQTLLVAQPLLSAFMDPELVEGYAELLAQPEAVDRLAQRLESARPRREWLTAWRRVDR
jgi:hypothetical protein